MLPMLVPSLQLRTRPPRLFQAPFRYPTSSAGPRSAYKMWRICTNPAHDRLGAVTAVKTRESSRVCAPSSVTSRTGRSFHRWRWGRHNGRNGVDGCRKSITASGSWIACLFDSLFHSVRHSALFSNQTFWSTNNLNKIFWKDIFLVLK